jgi:hypothetical protein
MAAGYFSWVAFVAQGLMPAALALLSARASFARLAG